VLGALLAAPASASAATKATECRGADDQITLEALDSAERTMLCMVNVYRTSQGVPLMTEDANLETAARKHSKYMEKTQQVDHKDIGDGTPTTRAEDAGFRCGGSDCVGENIIYFDVPVVSPRDLFDGLTADPLQDRSMLDPHYVTAGMGFYVGPHFGTTGTQDFSYVSNGATGTAADMLTNPACDSARSSLEQAKAKVRKAKKALAAANGADEHKLAKAKLKKAKRRVETRAGAVGPACDLAY
jgi:uncharacterized protein YkwD